MNESADPRSQSTPDGAPRALADLPERPPPALPPLPPRRKQPDAPNRKRLRAGDRRARRQAAAADQDETAADAPPGDAALARASGNGPARRHRARTSGRSSWFRFAAGGAFAVAFGLVAYGAVRPRTSNTTALGLVAIPLVVVITYLVVRRAAARETRFDLLGVMMLGLGLRFIGAFARFSAPADALVYHEEGSRIAPALRGLDFGVDTGRPIPGTGWIRYVSGITHAFVIDDMFVTFVIFTFLSFIGAFLCYLAFARAIPEGDHRRYALLIFLWPALVFWPSSLGKEAWMVFGLGIAAWGVARLVTGRPGVGLLVTAVGLGILSLVRPHVALMVLVGLGVALLARPRSRSTFRFTGRIVIVIVLLIGGSLIVERTSELLKVDLTGAESFTTALVETRDQTDTGGAKFNAAVVRTPLDYPAAFVTVWFRPFPNEVRDLNGVVSAAENLALLLLVLASWRRLLGLVRNLFRLPYATFAAAYSLVFVYAFSVIANFGILDRQRTQGLVLFFVLLCVPAAGAARAPRLPGRERAHHERTARRLRRESTNGPEPAGERPVALDVPSR